ncbi:MAG: SWIM zinc finger family protein [Chloroflexi bacterium]|nr:SWIM zinc finger family protein [Chloroflexota bacterium]
MKLSEFIIRAGTTPESFMRGEKLYRDGAISSATVQGNVLSALCEGTQTPYYRVTAALDEAGVREAVCTCPYDWGGFCKHIVALLLTYLHQPKSFVVRQAPAELLAKLSREELASLLAKLMERDADLYDWIATEVSVPATESKKKPIRKGRVDADVYRRQVAGIIHRLDTMRPSVAYWHASELVTALREVMTKAQKFLDEGDAESAMQILLVLVEEAVEGIDSIDDSDGDYTEFIGELDLPLAEAILSASLTPGERAEVLKKLRKIDQRFQEYGDDVGFDAAIEAATHGWEGDSASKKRVSHPPPSYEEAWDHQEDDDDFEGVALSDTRGDLTEAKLNVLQRQGKTEEYLALCKKEGRHLRFVLKLCELGRVMEATNYALDHLSTSAEAFQMARWLRDGTYIPEAIVVGERGLQLWGNKTALGEWLASIEEAQGRTEQALQAWYAVFEETPSLKIYQHLKRLGAAEWQTLQLKLMDILKKHYYKGPLAEVLLHEEQWDAAIKVAEENNNWHDIIALVADAVASHRPEWVVRVCKKQAEGLIARTQSKYYPDAAEWLKRVKNAYTQLGQRDAWHAYLNHLKEEYRRRPALQAQLKQL